MAVSDALPICKLNFDSEILGYDYSCNFRTQLRDKKINSPCNTSVLTEDETMIHESASPMLNNVTNGCSNIPGRLYKGYNVSPTNSISPPDRKVRAMRLFDSPSENIENERPSSVISRRNMSNLPSKTCLFGNRLRPSLNGIQSSLFSSDLNICNNSPMGRLTTLNKDDSTENKDMRANVNPFTPINIIRSSRKRLRKSQKKLNEIDNTGSLCENNNMDVDQLNGSFVEQESNISSTTSNHSSDEEDHLKAESAAFSDDYEDSDNDEDRKPTKRIAIHEMNVSRYHKEFAEISLIGKGEFGSAYLCRHRLDGCLYAVKRSIKPVAGSSNERRALNEVYAHAVLDSHLHVVRYYSSWAEEDHMIIQNEYCNGGSLASAVETHRKNGTLFKESQARTILLHAAKGLEYIHSHHLVHLDLKPENVFVVSDKNKHNTPPLSSSYGTGSSSADDGFAEEDSETDTTGSVVYKIGDLGNVTSIYGAKVEDGDCRYLPREMLEDDYRHLAKVDVFALGLTLYEVSSTKLLPLNGSEWQDIRNGELAKIPGYSQEFQDLLRLMMHPNPQKRPTAREVIDLLNSQNENVVSPKGEKLFKELEEAKLKNAFLEQQLNQAISALDNMKHYSFKDSISPTLSYKKVNHNNNNLAYLPQSMNFESDFCRSRFDNSVTETGPKPLTPQSSPDKDRPSKIPKRSYNTRSSNNKRSKSRTKIETRQKVTSQRFIGRKTVKSQTML